MTVMAVNLTIEQGEDFSTTFNIKNPDESVPTLTNYSTLGTVKKHSGATVGVAFTTSLNTSTGVISVGLAKTVTAGLSPGRYYYDVFLIAPDTSRKKVVNGNVLVNGSATLP